MKLLVAPWGPNDSLIILEARVKSNLNLQTMFGLICFRLSYLYCEFKFGAYDPHTKHTQEPTGLWLIHLTTLYCILSSKEGRHATQI